jgi:hypothetical protein
MSKINDGGPAFVIEAVVRFNKGEAFVLNRSPNFLYRRDGSRLVAEDGPFISCYQHSLPSGRFKAFAGRKFSIPLGDGTFEEASGQWWDSHLEGMTSCTYNTKADLLNCYVYYGCMANPEGIAALRAAYTGDVFPYYAYEAFIRLPVERRKYLAKISKLERDKTHLVRNLRGIKADRDAMLAARAEGGAE